MLRIALLTSGSLRKQFTELFALLEDDTAGVCNYRRDPNSFGIALLTSGSLRKRFTGSFAPLEDDTGGGYFVRIISVLNNKLLINLIIRTSSINNLRLSQFFDSAYFRFGVTFLFYLYKQSRLIPAHVLFSFGYFSFLKEK